MRWYFFPFQRCLDRDECRVRLKRNVCMQLEILGSPITSYAISAGSLVVSMFSFALMVYTNFNMNDKLTALENVGERVERNNHQKTLVIQSGGMDSKVAKNRVGHSKQELCKQHL